MFFDRLRPVVIRGGVEMSKQQEDFEKLAGDVLSKAQREKGPYRDVLLGVAEAYAALALHQGVFDEWARTFPVTPLARAQPQPAPSARSASQVASNASVGRQANENGKPTRPSAAA
jgi:hypothetical protein